MVDQVIFGGVDVDVDEGGAWQFSPELRHTRFEQDIETSGHGVLRSYASGLV